MVKQRKQKKKKKKGFVLLSCRVFSAHVSTWLCFYCKAVYSSKSTENPSRPMPCSCDNNCNWPKRYLCAVICIVITAGISVCFSGELPSTGLKQISSSTSQYWSKLFRSHFRFLWFFACLFVCLFVCLIRRCWQVAGMTKHGICHHLLQYELGRSLAKLEALSTLTDSFR